MSICISISGEKREQSERLAALVEQFQASGGIITPLDPVPPQEFTEPAIIRQIYGFPTVRLVSVSGRGFTVRAQTYG